MTRYRDRLPQLDGRPFLTDGGVETSLMFLEGIELPELAAIDLYRRPGGRDQLSRYFEPYLTLARDHGIGFVLESATWRASRDWTRRLGYDAGTHAAVNREAIAHLAELRRRFAGPQAPVVLSGNIGPRGDGYDPGVLMTVDAAAAYHADQIELFLGTEADMVTAMTMTNTPEAIGIAQAADSRSMPCVISFTLETDGRLPTGQGLGEAVREVDAETGSAPAYYMINCAHPTHFEETLAWGGAWTDRIRGLRANASTLSHAELDAATELDDGNPVQFGQDYARLRHLLPAANVFGGCCGTDVRHVGEICRRCLVEDRAA